MVSLNTSSGTRAARIDPRRSRQHVNGGVAHSIHLDDTRTGDSAATAQQADAPVLQPALLPGVEVVVDHEVTPSQRRLNIDSRIRCRSTGTMDCLSRTNQRL